MKKLLLLLAFLPAMVSGQAGVEEVGEAAVLMRSMPECNPSRMVPAYRVEIFSDNTATARARAYEAYAAFRELCPEIAADERRDIRYDSPKYTVRVGVFLTREEAVALCGRLRNAFTPYVHTEQMPLSNFIRSYNNPEPPVEEIAN